MSALEKIIKLTTFISQSETISYLTLAGIVRVTIPEDESIVQAVARVKIDMGKIEKIEIKAI